MRVIFTAIYLLCHLAVLGVFMLGIAARYIHPAVAWWLQAVAIGLPAVAVVLTLLTVIAFFSQRWVLFGTSAALLVLFAAHYRSALTEDASDGIDPLTVISFNTGGGVNNLEGGNRGIPLLLDAYEPDVLCMQEFSVGRRGPEAHTYGDVETLFDSLGYRIVAPAPPEGHRPPPPIISRLPFEESMVMGLSTRSETSPAGTVVRAQFTWKGRSFAVYDIHLQSFTTRRPWLQGETFSLRAWIRFIRRTSSAFLQRASEAEEIRRLVDSDELPFVLCGDFNTTPHQWVYQRLANGLKDAYRTDGGLWGPTFPSRFPVFRIDYVLASREWIVDDAEVGPELPPDHRPVVARLGLRPVD